MPHPATKLPQKICFEISVKSERLLGPIALPQNAKVKKRQTSSVIVTKNVKLRMENYGKPKNIEPPSTPRRTAAGFASFSLN